MKTSVRMLLGAVMASAILSMGAAAQAQDATESTSPLREGPYIAPMASYIFTDDKAFGNGIGGTLAAGYRKDWWAVEASALFDRFKGGHDGVETSFISVISGGVVQFSNPISARSTSAIGGTINGLIFPLAAVPNFYGVIGAGALDINHHPIIDREFSTTTIEGGLGYIFPLSFGRYEFGLRADARYRYGKREKRVDPGGDLDIPTHFEDVLINVGFQLPLGLRPINPADDPAKVVPLAPICSDGIDNDGDGLIDFPADKGCTSADDGDETDPPQCSDGIDNDGDGLIDFPADKGCTSADDNDEADPCKTPAIGEKLSLKGCGTGDVVVLNGVNFDFDKSSLTLNAKTILDGVADELQAYPDILIELGGHTDSKGSDDYNQRLSDKRAASVLKYLASKGVAKSRMTSVGYGETQPVADNETDEGRELNRRVELKVTGGSAVATTPAEVAPAADSAAAPAEAAPVDAAAPAEAASPEPAAEALPAAEPAAVTP